MNRFNSDEHVQFHRIWMQLRDFIKAFITYPWTASVVGLNYICQNMTHHNPFDQGISTLLYY